MIIAVVSGEGVLGSSAGFRSFSFFFFWVPYLIGRVSSLNMMFC